jgi:hypothetical protein
MRSSHLRLLHVIALILPVAAGCAHHAAQKPTSVTPSAQATIPLPEWAPKNPSPEFLRAARVLKPIPPEEIAGSNLTEAMKARYGRLVCGAAYEFFGTLTDEQIHRFLATKEIRIRVRDLTKPQRAALDAWFEAYREFGAGGPPEASDYLIMLYKMGAREDLSNVRVGFQALVGGHAVHIAFWVTPPAKKETWINTHVAQI